MLPWVAPDGDGSRLLGVDVARAVALLGMIATHVFAATNEDGTLNLSHQVFSGRSSALFAVLAGVSTALVTGRREPLRGQPRRSAGLALALRALALAVLGMALVSLDTDIAIILTYYGVLFVCGLPFLGLRPPALFALAAAGCLLLPLASYGLRAGLDLQPTFAQPAFDRLDAPGQLLEELLLTGYYPVIGWLVYLLVGMAVGRLDLRSRTVAAALLVGGAVLTVLAHAASAALVQVGEDPLRAALPDPDGIGLTGVVRRGSFGVVPTDTPWLLVVDGPHTGTGFDLAATSGSALAVLGACLLVLHLGRPARAAVLPLAGAGAMTLTLYSLHVWAVSRWDGQQPGGFYAVQIAVGLAAALAWRTVIGRGPLEAMLAAITHAVRAGRQARTVA